MNIDYTKFYQIVKIQVMQTLPQIAVGLLVFLIFWLAGCLAKFFIARLANRSENHRYLYRLIGQVVKVAIIIAGAISGLGTMGVNVSALVASLGLAGFALGFAFKDVLSNVLAGFLVLFYRPFRVGDTIAVGAFKGEVVDINLRYTVINSDSEHTLLPNSTILTSPVTVHG